ncbi:MAG: LysM peptidoglycan-binding domain-containing protein [Saprospiraceae bacterium]|nr:LysM peptidoglycan-binding domain-containing protein [Saprospiraceae bacterium]
MAESGKLEKMQIIAYKDASLSDDKKIGSYTAMMNPESYTLDYKIEYNEEQGQGTSSTQQRYKLTKPEEMSFEFLFDNTGIIDEKPRSDIHQEITTFRDLLVKYEGEIHEPKHFKLAWGTILFKGRLTSLNIAFKLFKPDGTPIRAVAKATFKGSIEENLRVAKEDAKSPDLTHLRLVKAGDTLPMMCYRIYGDPRYYLEVAKVNGLGHFRRLEPGMELLFPPLEKTAKR